MLVLFMCLAIAVVTQTLVTVTVCAERAVYDEATGRTRLAEKDRALVALRQLSLASWEAVPWTILSDDGDGDGECAVEGNLTAVADQVDWIMDATVRQDATASRLVTSAWIERGRDGLDLPLAALVAESVTVTPGREVAWLEVEPAPAGQAAGEGPGHASEGVGYLREMPAEPLVGAGASLVDIAESWRLDGGWCGLASESGGRAVAPAPGVIMLTGIPGRAFRLPEECGGLAPNDALLVIVTGGADLDAEGRGDFYGVVVVDDGSVLLNGTSVHGAVFAGETVHLGQTGRVVFSRIILRWATDRSLIRTRLVPGTRREGIE
jgi:hypothetical protein